MSKWRGREWATPSDLGTREERLDEVKVLKKSVPPFLKDLFRRTGTLFNSNELAFSDLEYHQS